MATPLPPEDPFGAAATDGIAVCAAGDQGPEPFTLSALTRTYVTPDALIPLVAVKLVVELVNVVGDAKLLLSSS